MAFEPFSYSKSWKNPKDFPAYEPDEGQVRADLQLLHDEAAAAINGLIAALNDPTAADHIPVSVEGLRAETVRQAIEQVYAAVREAAAGLIVDGSVTREKLDAELLKRIYGGRVWISMNEPTKEHKPDTDFPVGQLWLRPGWNACNLAENEWEVLGGGAVQEGELWCFTTDGSRDYLTASQLLEQVGKAGQRLLVRLRMGEQSPRLQELSLFLNGVEQQADDGTYEAVLDQTGSLEIMLRGQWQQAEAGEEIEVASLTVIDPNGLCPDGCEAFTDWENMPQHAETTLWIQTDHGIWEKLYTQVRTVSGGGTGLNAVEDGALLCGTGTDCLRTIKPEALAQMGGYLRIQTGTYEGTGGNGDRTLTLPVKPTVLLISADNGSCDTACLMNGGRSSGKYTYIIGNLSVPYTAQVTLSDDVLTFTNDRTGSYADCMLTQYMNAKGVGYRWLALY